MNYLRLNEQARNTQVISSPTRCASRMWKPVWMLCLFLVTYGLWPGASSGAVIGGPITNPANSHVYYLLSAQTWSNSEAEAVSLRGHLVTINDAAEQDWVWTTFSPSSPYFGQLWIGLSDFAQRSNYVWSSGASLSYTDWSPGNPSYESGGVPERCVHMWEQYGGQWNDATAGYANPCGVVEVVPVVREPICDEFSTSSVNSNLWTVSLPFGSSQMFQTNGRAVFISRGGLTSKADFFKALEITGRFRFAGSLDQFKVFTRTDGTEDPAWHERYGIMLNFSQIDNEITLDEQREDGLTNLGAVSLAFSLNTDVDFRMVDDGTNVAVYINGAASPSIAGASSYRKGNKVSVYNRENVGSRSELDFVCIAPIIPRLELLNAVELRWVSITNQTYQVQSSTNLVDWTDFGSPISTPPGSTNHVFDSISVPKKFYRLGVQ